MKDKKHLYWVIGLVLIALIISSTAIWLNHNSWTIRFEMDDNTLKAVESIDWESLSEDEDVIGVKDE